MTVDPDINPKDSDYLSRPDVQGHLRVQAFLRQWDPIGLGAMGLTKPLEDEYNAYAPAVMERLGYEDSHERLMPYLKWLATEQIGAVFDEAKTRDLVSELCEWWNVWKQGDRK